LALHKDQERCSCPCGGGQWHSPRIYWEIKTKTGCAEKMDFFMK
jgi:hypothetical protein